MRSKWLVLMAACLLLAIGMGTAQAYPQLTAGTTGLVQTPTAYLVGARTFDLAVDYGKIDVGGGLDFQTWPIRLVAGVSDNAELGGAYARLDPNISGPPDVKVTAFGGKWQFRPEDERSPAVALGANYGEVKANSTTDKIWSVYLVATKKLTQQEEGAGLTGNLGVIYDNYSNGTKENFVTPFVGIEIGTPGGTTIGVDYKWKQEKSGWTWFEALFGAVVRHPINENLSVEVGTTNILGWDTTAQIFGGVKLQFGGGQE